MEEVIPFPMVGLPSPVLCLRTGRGEQGEVDLSPRFSSALMHQVVPQIRSSRQDRLPMDDQEKTRKELLKELEGLRVRLRGIEKEAKRPKRDAFSRKRSKEAGPERSKSGSTLRSRSRFLSYIAHELKTPLNSLLGFIQLLRNGTFGALSPEQSRAMTRMNMDVLEIVHLVDNVLDLSRIDSGKMPVQAVSTHLQELVERVCMIFEPFLNEKELHLERVIDPACPTRLMTDPVRMKSALSNLLSNAIKFTQRGRIQIELHPLSEQGGIRLSVSDTGVGIAAQDLEKIFEEYEQGVVKEAGSSYGSGTGLGLAIVRKMVASLGGTIRVESKLGVGSTFIVDVPDRPLSKK
ncbi:MAG: HAMP domain-containing histidine kinase [Candidatus Manganitrophaceae bacterium]|nr:MAG: HAMP domain-containing histidine kinase [Candidatus Manganitrophaceae bacterium]